MSRLPLRTEVERMTERIFGAVAATQDCSDPELADDRYVEFRVEVEDAADAARKYDQWQRALLALAGSQRASFHICVDVQALRL